METQAPRLRRLMPIAVMALAMVLVVVAGWSSFGGALPLEARSYRVHVPLRDALNIEPGADVTIAGVHVGDVVGLGLTKNQPTATIELKPEFAPLRRGAIAIPREKSLLGEPYLEIAPGPASATAVPEGGSLARANVRSAQALDEVLGAFTPESRRNFHRLAAGMASALRGRSEDLSAIVGNAPATAGGLARVVEQLDGQRADLSQLVASSADVFMAVGEREGALQAAVQAGDSVLATTGRHSRALAALVHVMPSFLARLTTASGQITGTSGDLATAVRALRPAAPLALPVIERLERTAPLAARAFRALSPTLTAGARGLPSATRVVQAVGPSFAKIYPTTREIIPTLQLLSTVRDSAVSFFANFGQMIWGRIREGNYNGTVVSAMPSFWNESVGGWVKKLPSSRGNPWPKPGALLQIAEGNPLSYDCRHIHNTMWIPPTGGRGAPPCVTQGPWTYRGTTAYYPRLPLASP